jgi:uroporphyrinogen decarboxylase
MATLTSRERVSRALTRRQPDRVPIYDRFWFETECDFRDRLGCPFPAGTTWANANAYGHVHGTLWEHFDMDLLEVGWPDYRLRMIDPEVIDESDEWVLHRDGNGAVLRWWKHKMGTPEHVDYTVVTPDAWAAVKSQLSVTRDRIRWDEFRPLYCRARDAERFVCYGTVEPFEIVKDVLGHEVMLMAMIEYPDWLHEVFDTYTTMAIRLFELNEAEGMPCDGAFVYGDIAYRNGPFMSPAHYREFLQPYHRRFFDEFARRGMPVIYHSDGDIRMVTDDLIDAGVSAIQPMENSAGMDLRELAPVYGERLAFVGNIDVKVMLTNDADRVREEVRSKLAAAMPYSGYMYHSDHSVPPGVTMETYETVLAEVRFVGRYDA